MLATTTSYKTESLESGRRLSLPVQLTLAVSVFDMKYISNIDSWGILLIKAQLGNLAITHTVLTAMLT